MTFALSVAKDEGAPKRVDPRVDGEPIDGTLVPHRAAGARTFIDVTL
ncbi:MAG: hypothetical protein SGI86_12695 [Deltaproteobacteria bacterium]|nr:hypothetical protein [Deltaproteobacteria bacterium]